MWPKTAQTNGATSGGLQVAMRSQLPRFKNISSYTICSDSAAVLCTVSVVVDVDAELYVASVDDVVQCEERIVSQSRALLPAGSRGEVERKVDELDEILGRFGCETSLVVIRRANSLALYFICMTLAALMSLRDQWRSRQLRYTLQSLFTFLSGATSKVCIERLTWPLSNYERCLDFFSSVEG